MINKNEKPLISVIICAFSLKRLKETVACINSILDNNYKNFEIIVVIDGNHELRQILEAKIKGTGKILFIENKKNEGPSVSRNLGVKHAKGEIVAFIDDDAFSQPDWLEYILKNFSEYPDIAACGGKLIPVYEKGARKLPEELLWIVGCTYKGHPTKKQFVRNVISANMAVRKDVFNEVQFEKMFDGVNWKMEDTLFGIRLFMKNARSILYDPDMAVYHNVSRDRTRLIYIFLRAFSEGALKFKLGQAIRIKFQNKQIFHQEQNYLKILFLSILRNGLNFRLNDCLTLSLTIVCVACGYSNQILINQHAIT